MESKGAKNLPYNLRKTHDTIQNNNKKCCFNTDLVGDTLPLVKNPENVTQGKTVRCDRSEPVKGVTDRPGSPAKSHTRSRFVSNRNTGGPTGLTGFNIHMHPDRVPFCHGSEDGGSVSKFCFPGGTK